MGLLHFGHSYFGAFIVLAFSPLWVWPLDPGEGCTLSSYKGEEEEGELDPKL